MAGGKKITDRAGIDALIAVLARRGYRVVGPTVRDRTIVYDDITATDDLPVGFTEEQDGGHYRLQRRDDEALFGYSVGPHTFKQFLHAPRVQLYDAAGPLDRVRLVDAEQPAPFAFIGARSCELHAIAIQDRVLLGGDYVDRHYRERREGLFVVAVNCATAGGTCFCVSMETGPKAGTGFDLALTEIPAGDSYEYLVEIGSDAGAEVAGELPLREAQPAQIDAAGQVVEATASAMGRQMAADGVRELLLDNLDHPRWDDVAERCLTCGNCTMVCPTCFCTAVEDESDLDSGDAGRSRRWDSCFTMDYSYIHGGSVRATPKSRYRQWMTHKLATWHDQFDTAGCVGCGRCITWCPVGIDITEEVAAIRGGSAGN